MQDIVAEIKVNFDVLKEAFERKEDTRSPPVFCGMVVRSETIARGKRCVLAYLYQRFLRSKDMWWETGGAVPEEIKTALSQNEVTALNAYDSLMSDYMRKTGVSLISDQSPPKDVLIEVAVKEDCGEILTENGPVTLLKDTRHLMRRSDAELLIKQGLLEQVQRLNTR